MTACLTRCLPRFVCLAPMCPFTLIIERNEYPRFVSIHLIAVHAWAAANRFPSCKRHVEELCLPIPPLASPSLEFI